MVEEDHGPAILEGEIKRAAIGLGECCSRVGQMPDKR
jgi:hypothetical protein